MICFLQPKDYSVPAWWVSNTYTSSAPLKVLQWETQIYLGDVIGTVQDELAVSS